MKSLILKFREEKILNYIASALIIAFIILITIGSYRKIKTVVSIFFFIIAIGLLILNFKHSLRDLVKSSIMWMWVIYSVVGGLSTLFVSTSNDFYVFITSVLFTVILFSLTRIANINTLIFGLRYFLLVMCLLSFFQLISNIPVWNFLKEGTTFPAMPINDIPHICSIFEYRHYYGCYLVMAFLSLFFFPEKVKPLNYIFGVTFIVAIILTYTRSVWIALFIVIALLVVSYLINKRKNNQNKHKSIHISKWQIICIICAIVAVLAVVLISYFRGGFIKGVFDIINTRVHESFDINNASFNNRYFNIVEGFKYSFSRIGIDLWIGSGSGSALEWLANAEGAPFIGAIDNQYTFTLIENGLLGLILLVGMVVFSVIQIFNRKSPMTRLCAATFLAISIAFAFFEVVVVSSSIFVLWLLCLCYMADGKMWIEKKDPVPVMEDKAVNNSQL